MQFCVFSSIFGGVSIQITLQTFNFELVLILTFDKKYGENFLLFVGWMLVIKNGIKRDNSVNNYFVRTA